MQAGKQHFVVISLVFVLASTMQAEDANRPESPKDSSAYLIFLQGGKLYRVAFAGTVTKVTKLTDSENEYVTRIHLTEEGKAIVVLLPRSTAEDYVFDNQVSKTPSTSATEETLSESAITSVIREGVALTLVRLDKLPHFQVLGSMAFSPDGNSLAYVGKSQVGLGLNLVNLKTKKVKVLFTGWTVLTSLSWSCDGRKIAYFANSLDKHGNGGFCLRLVELDTGHDIQVAPPTKIFSIAGFLPPGTPIWSRNDKRIYFDATYDEGATGCYACETTKGAGKPIRVTDMHRDGEEGEQPFTPDGIIPSWLYEKWVKAYSLPKYTGTIYLSPDKKLIAFEDIYTLRVKNLETGKEQIISNNWVPYVGGFFWFHAPLSHKTE